MFNFARYGQEPGAFARPVGPSPPRPPPATSASPFLRNPPFSRIPAYWISRYRRTDSALDALLLALTPRPAGREIGNRCLRFFAFFFYG